MKKRLADIDKEILDPTPEIGLDTIKERSVTGVIALTGRYFVLYVMALIAQIFLGIYLTPAEWGVFALASAVTDFLVYFSDVGLAASLIQSEKEISDDDLKTTFTIQQALVISLLLILVIFSSKIGTVFGLERPGMMLLYALGFSLFLSSLRTIPTVLLERKIEFHKIAFVNVAEAAIYYSLLVFSAARGAGINSFTYAIVGRAIVGVVLMYIVSPWIPKFGISWSSLKRLLAFGVPYQANTLIALAKDRGTTLLLGKILGLEALGILDWAQKWSQISLRIVLDSVTKVTFPAFSRMQKEREHLPRSVTRSIFFITLLAFPAITGLVILAPVVIQIIPKYEKWTPALLPLTFFAVNAIFAAFTTQLTNLLNAIGKIKITFYLMIMWGSLTLLVIPYLAGRYGANGAALGYAIVSSSSVVAVYLAKRYVNFSLSDSVVKPFLAASAMAVVLIIVRGALPPTVYSLSILVIVGVAVYGVIIVGMVGKSLMDDAKRSLRTLLNRRD